MSPALKISAAVLAVALTALPLASQAASTRNPAQSPNLPSAEQTTSVGDPFLPERGFNAPRNKSAVNIHMMDCHVSETVFGPEGQAYLMFKNTGDTVIPAGMWFTYTLSDGTTGKLQIPADIKPGDAVGIYAPDDMGPGFRCAVHVTKA
jgi:hypothetical protein